MATDIGLIVAQFIETEQHDRPSHLQLAATLFE